MKLVIAGGTGFLGQFLIKTLVAEKHEITLLSRRKKFPPNLADAQIKKVFWDGRFSNIWAYALEGAEGILNFCGEGVADKRWNKARKNVLLNSRIETTAALVRAISNLETKPAFLINGSAIGYYGNVEFGEVNEKSVVGGGFLADLCKKWEAEARQAEDLGVRVVNTRTGLVLGKGGGVLKKMTPAFKMFAGGHLGSGNQWFSWLHQKDFVRAILFCIESNKIRGPVNLTAPDPVTLRGFCKTLGKVLGRPSWAHLPGPLLKIMLGEMSQAITEGQRALPAKLISRGFQFNFPILTEALDEIFLN